MTMIGSNTKYRIYIENVSKNATEQAKNIVGEHFNSFTVFYGEGHQEGETRKAVIFEVLAAGTVEEEIKRTCQKLQMVLHQDAVLYTKQSIYSEFVVRKEK